MALLVPGSLAIISVSFSDEQRGRAIGTNVSADADAQAALKRAIGESFVSAFRLVSLLGATLALLNAFRAWLLVAGKHLEPAGG